MIEKEDVRALYSEWLSKLKEATDKHVGYDICESSRMVVSMCSIFRAYYQEAWTREMLDEVEVSLEKALSNMTEDLENGRDPDGHLAIYKRNVHQRLRTLKDVYTRIEE